MSICAADCTPNTFCTHSGFTLIPSHKYIDKPFSKSRQQKSTMSNNSHVKSRKKTGMIVKFEI